LTSLREITVCYVVVDPQLRTHANWCYVSASSVKRCHPDARIVVVTDKETGRAIEREGHCLRRVASEVRSIEVAKESLRHASRFIKTALREIVDGDLVYLDTDTVVIRPIDGVCEGSQVCAVARDTSVSAAPKWYGAASRDLGWPTPADGSYFNGGVLFVRDNPLGREFGRKWHARWLEWKRHDGSGVCADQPSLNACVAELGESARVLDSSYNTIVRRASDRVGDARVLHYLASLGGIPRASLISRLWQGRSRDGEMDWSALEAVRDSESPWVRSRSVVQAELVARGMKRVAIRRLRRSLPKHMRAKYVR